MSQIDKVANAHPIRKRAIECGITSACASCKHSKYRSNSVEDEMVFQGCSLDPDDKTEVKKCSDYSIDLNMLEDEEREYYGQEGICWD